MKKIIDPLSFDLLLGFCGALLSLYGGRISNNKSQLWLGVIIMLSALAYLAYLIKFGKAQIVENKYNGMTLIKPENGELDSVGHGILKPVDGIHNLGNKEKPIRKFRNGVNVRIDKHGNPNAVNPISRIIGQSDHNVGELDITWRHLESAIKDKQNGR